MMNYAEYHDACTAIIRVLDERPGGRKDEAALAAIGQQVIFLRGRFGHLGYFAEKLLEVDEHAAILFSARRHRQWDRDETSGAQLQAGWVRRAANSFSDHLRQFERSGKEPPAPGSV